MVLLINQARHVAGSVLQNPSIEERTWWAADATSAPEGLIPDTTLREKSHKVAGRIARYICYANLRFKPVFINISMTFDGILPY